MKILVIGANGYLGNTIFKKLKESVNNDIYGTCCNSSSQGLLRVNVLNKLDINKLLSLRPDIIIWSIRDEEEEISLSQTGLKEIVNAISENVRFIYVSTTVGEGKDQTENVVPCRRMPDEYLWKYVNGKIKGESIAKKHTNHVIVRPGSIYGYGYDGKMDSRMRMLLEISKAGKKYSRTANMYTSFINVKDLSDAIIELIYSDFTGIINISEEKPVSYYDFNIHLAKLLSIDSDFIIPDYKQEEVYTNLNNDKRKLILGTLIGEI